MDTIQLKKLGFKKAVNDIEQGLELKRKMTIAYEHFRYVKQEKIDAFNAKLRKETEETKDYSTIYDTLQFTLVADYGSVPPAEVLEKVEEAQKLGCFDIFEIATVKSVEERKDPIIFGRINGCPDRFFIAQWDDDVKVEDILDENEG